MLDNAHDRTGKLIKIKEFFQHSQIIQAGRAALT